jgi:hypothetical protein
MGVDQALELAIRPVKAAFSASPTDTLLEPKELEGTHHH